MQIQNVTQNNRIVSNAKGFETGSSQTCLNKELPLLLSYICKNNLKKAFKAIKTHHLLSPSNYFKSRKILIAKSKKSTKLNQNFNSIYSVQQKQNQSPIVTISILSARINFIRKRAFFNIKELFYSLKSAQAQVSVKNLQSQLLDYFIAKIQSKLTLITFRKISVYSKKNKQTLQIINVIQMIVSNILKKVFMSHFIRKIKSKARKFGQVKLISLSFQKLFKFFTLNLTQQGFKKMYFYQHHLDVEQKVTQKKQLISKISQLSSLRSAFLQRERQILNSLKSKLDQSTVDKYNLINEKRHSLLLFKTKFGQNLKLMQERLTALQANLNSVTVINQKQLHIRNFLQTNRNYVQDLNQRGVNFQHITTTIFKIIFDFTLPSFEDIFQSIKQHEEKWNCVQNIFNLDNISNQREYKLRKISFLEKLLRISEKTKQRQTLRTSRFSRTMPLRSSLGSQLNKNFIQFGKGSSITLTNPELCKDFFDEHLESVYLKEQYEDLQSLISLTLSQSYELKIQEAITAEIELLAQLLANDLKQNESCS